MEMALIGGFAYFYWTWDTAFTDGERGKEVETTNKEIEKRMGGMSDPMVINQKELELVKRNVNLPEREPTEPAKYEAQLDMLLIDTASSSLGGAPMAANKREEYGPPSYRNAGKAMTDYLYFKYPREPPRNPEIDWAE